MRYIKKTASFIIFISLAGILFAQEKSASSFLGISSEALNEKLKIQENTSPEKQKTSVKTENNIKTYNQLNKSNQKEILKTKEEKTVSKENSETTDISHSLNIKKTDSLTLNNRNDSLVAYAKQFLGARYRYGGMSPTSGFDCSGFVNYVFLHFGVKLPRSSTGFVKLKNKVTKDNCQKADIMVFAGGNPAKRPVGHVGIIISTDNNDIEFIHASTRSKNGGIIITKLSESEYYQKRLVTIVRE